MKEERNDTSLVVGRNPVREALERRPEQIEKVMIRRGVSGAAIAAIRDAAAAAGVPVQHVPEARLHHEAGDVNHQGVIAMAAPVQYRIADELLAEIAPSWDAVRAKKPLLLVIDRVTDPRNFGAVLRSAAAAGVDGVFVPNQHMAPLNAAAIKASAGTATRVPIARVNDLPALLKQLKERSYWVIGADGTADTSVWQMEWDRPTVLVIGSEGEGLQPSVREACDRLVAIPMRGPVESLNVAVAAGILLFAASRPRLESTPGPDA
ncbi:MAG: 23S rRNA (guanosine(2251)-2'-O)-methyltransferase RlmB [Bacteroidetes bacterium]|jgi:23S rRNA (guanosine2251-2'-O)-methyltransferase|nr:23S rRNA (guanosine(2251)-2'-O)-methyltransferase RlmB [Bacteroidota bacterium]